jgi:hypothetical protein
MNFHVVVDRLNKLRSERQEWRPYNPPFLASVPRFAAVVSLLFLLVAPIAHGQDEAVAYSWQAGDLSFTYPSTWAAPTEIIRADTTQLTLTDTTHEDTQLTIERIVTPTTRVFDLMATALAEQNVSVGAPTTLVLAGIPALEVHERSPESGRVGIGRGTTLADGSALLVYGSAPRDHGNSLLLAFDQIVNSLVLGAYQMPQLTDGSTVSRIGDEILLPDVPALGSLTFALPAQLWSFQGESGETISLYALDINRTEALNVRIRLAAPEGTIIAENDNHSGAALYGLFSLYDAGLYDVTLPIDGVYTVQVESVFGEGVYAIGLRRAKRFTLAATDATRLFGSISDVFANQTWLFEAEAGAIYTFTMFAEGNSTLDPALRLYSSEGRVIAQNDDARDPALGLNAQLPQVTLPTNGLYRLEATRYAGEGAGNYEIVIVATGG